MLETAEIENFKVVLVEDNDDLRNATAEFLSGQGYSVIAIESAEALIEHNVSPHVYIIDINLPGESGISLIERIRRADPAVGIIVASARQKPEHVVEGYNTGADIYLTKPIDPSELTAALNSLHRRLFRSSDDFDGVTVYPNQSRMQGPQRTIRLTHGEVNLLRSLAVAPEGVLETWEAAEVLGLEIESNFKSALEVRMVRLRKKLDAAGITGQRVQAVRGRGYRLCCEVRISVD